MRESYMRNKTAPHPQPESRLLDELAATLAKANTSCETQRQRDLAMSAIASAREALNLSERALLLAA